MKVVHWRNVSKNLGHAEVRWAEWHHTPLTPSSKNTQLWSMEKSFLATVMHMRIHWQDVGRYLTIQNLYIAMPRLPFSDTVLEL